MIGDSFYDLTEIPQDLWQLARSAGSLGAQEQYRHYYRSGAMLSPDLVGLVPAIPTQWDDAIREDPAIKVVLMNGGGNDALVGDRSCLTEAPPQNQQCAKTLDGVVKSVRTLLDEMAAAGVEAVVYAFYPHMPTFGLFQGYAPAINDTLDYGQALAQKECESATAVRCYFVSTMAAFEGHPEYIGSLPIGDLDVHASPAGSKVAAQLIWDTMVEHCIAQ